MLADHVLRRLHRARDLVHADFAEPLALRDLARAANMSSFHFLREFRVAFGETPRRCLSRIRLERARELLLRSTSVTETCHAVGFSSLGSFSTAFAGRYGCSPRAYQEQFRIFATVPEKLLSLYVPTCFASFWARQSNRREAPAASPA
jgi:AraC-like DNA-binding protein